MKNDPSRAPQFSAVRRALVLAGGTLLLAVSCTAPPAPDGNIFAPRYGYGSPQANPSGRALSQAERTANNARKQDGRKIPDIKRDPNNTTVDVTPPEPKPDKTEAAPPTSEDGTSPASTDTPAVEKTTAETTDTTTPTETKPAVTREDLPFGQPVVGKKGYVYSPYAPDKGQVDVQDIPAGTKVKCPYTDKVFRVP